MLLVAIADLADATLDADPGALLLGWVAGAAVASIGLAPSRWCFTIT
jgi:hypothetical protein